MEWWKVFALIFLVALAMLSTEFLKDTSSAKQELIRKIPHILIGGLLTISPYYLTKKEILISALILFLGVWIGKYSPFFKKIFSIKRITYGMWVTPISYGIMAWLWLPDKVEPFIFGLLVLTFSDALASLLGVKWGKKRWYLMGKSWLGSLSFFLTTLLILGILKGFKMNWEYFEIALILTISEIYLIFGLDNLILPILASYLFYWLVL